MGTWTRALRALEELGERFGFFNPKFTVEDFKKHLRDRDAIEEVNGKTVLTKAGERMIRKDSLDRIFGNLAKDSAGEHRVPRTGSGGRQDHRDAPPMSSAIPSRTSTSSRACETRCAGNAANGETRGSG